MLQRARFRRDKRLFSRLVPPGKHRRGQGNAVYRLSTSVIIVDTAPLFHSPSRGSAARFRCITAGGGAPARRTFVCLSNRKRRKGHGGPHRHNAWLSGCSRSCGDPDSAAPSRGCRNGFIPAWTGILVGRTGPCHRQGGRDHRRRRSGNSRLSGQTLGRAGRYWA